MLRHALWCSWLERRRLLRQLAALLIASGDADLLQPAEECVRGGDCGRGVHDDGASRYSVAHASAAIIQRSWHHGAPKRARAAAARVIAGSWRRISRRWRNVLDAIAAQSSCALVFERADAPAVGAAIAHALAWAEGRRQRIYVQARSLPARAARAHIAGARRGGGGGVGGGVVQLRARAPQVRTDSYALPLRPPGALHASDGTAFATSLIDVRRAWRPLGRLRRRAVGGGGGVREPAPARAVAADRMIVRRLPSACVHLRYGVSVAPPRHAIVGLGAARVQRSLRRLSRRTPRHFGKRVYACARMGGGVRAFAVTGAQVREICFGRARRRSRGGSRCRRCAPSRRRRAPGRAGNGGGGLAQAVRGPPSVRARCCAGRRRPPRRCSWCKGTSRARGSWWWMAAGMSAVPPLWRFRYVCVSVLRCHRPHPPV